MSDQQYPLFPKVEIKPLKTHADSRGFFRELIRNTDPFFAEGFAQWSHSRMAHNTVKAWHFHHKQVDWWYVPFGVAEVVLIDFREDSPTYKQKFQTIIGEKAVDSRAEEIIIKIPQGVLHACKVISEEAHLFYITSQTYDPQDEGRYPFDSLKEIHHWGDEEFIVSEQDTKTHIPPYSIIK